MKGEKGNIVLVHFRGHDVAGVVTSATDSFCGVRITHTRTIWPKHEDIIRILEPQLFQIGQTVQTVHPVDGIPAGATVTIIDYKLPRRWKNIKYGIEYTINNKKVRRLTYGICLTTN